MACEIITNLWLGNIIDSRNLEFINTIDVVINCTKNLPFNSESNKQIRVYVDDNLEKQEIVNMYKHLDKITQTIDELLTKGKSIFVHCYAGKQRSATVICAYLMKYLKLSFSDAKNLLRSKRMIVFTPLTNFDAALRLFEINLNKSKA
jgi:dual specificity MAP kinase phosphatase